MPADFDAYRHYSQLFKQAVAGVVGDIEDRGIDEIYIELDADAEAAGRQAVLIKRAVNEATGLSCSIGVAPNKLLAKICSDLDKPDGLTILMAEDIPRRIWPLAVRKVNGIGPKADAKLAALGIHTIAELARAEAELLQTHFGRSYAAWLREVALGVDERALVTSSEPKSISRETTFERDLHARQDRAALTEIFTALCVRVAQDLSGKGYLARTIGIKLRFADFSTVTRDVTLPEATADAAAVRAAAGECLRRVPLAQRVRLLGVRASALCTPDAAAPARAWAQGELCFGA